MKYVELVENKYNIDEYVELSAGIIGRIISFTTSLSVEGKKRFTYNVKVINVVNILEEDIISKVVIKRVSE